MHYEQRRKSNALNPAAPSATFVDDPNASICYLEGVIKLGSKSRAVYNCKFAALCHVIFLHFSWMHLAHTLSYFVIQQT